MSSGFDVTLAGTSERAWESMLERFPLVPTPTGALVVVAPHPDDETLGAGGLIQLCAERCQSIRIINVTAGEAAYPGTPDLARIRAQEMRSALACLSATPIEVHRLGMPDGGVAARELQLCRAIDFRVQSGDVLVAPFERDGHPDHDAVGRACLNIARHRGLTLFQYPIWAWHHSSPQAFGTAAFVRVALTRRAQIAKRQAIDCYDSQLRPTGGRTPILPGHVLTHFARPYEAFLTCPTT